MLRVCIEDGQIRLLGLVGVLLGEVIGQNGEYQRL